MLMGDWGLDTRGPMATPVGCPQVPCVMLNGCVQVQLQYDQSEPAEGLPLVALSRIESTWHSRNLGSDNLMVPAALGPWEPTEEELKVTDDAVLCLQYCNW